MGNKGVLFEEWGFCGKIWKINNKGGFMATKLIKERVVAEYQGADAFSQAKHEAGACCAAMRGDGIPTIQIGSATSPITDERGNVVGVRVSIIERS